VPRQTAIEEQEEPDLPVGTINFGGNEVFVDPEESDSESLARDRLGRKPQVGGGLAVFIGVLQLLFFPSVPPGAPLNLHQMAIIFILIGVLLIAVGTFARWYYLD
jgi:hypothetical protein